MKRVLSIIFMATLPAMIFSQEMNYHDLFPVDTIYFEVNNIPFQIEPSTNNCWQVGQPSKTYFNSAFSPPLAIVTDTMNPYPVNSNSSFTFVIPPSLVQTSFTNYIEFNHKFDTDTLQDYGTIEASYDGGNTWEALKDTSCPDWSCVMLYWDSDYVYSTGQFKEHILQPTGRSEGWIRSRYFWWWMMPVADKPQPPDSIIVKFTFHSDASPSTKEGWMVDNILIGWRDEGTGLIEKDQKDLVQVLPNPLTGKSWVVCNIPGTGFDFSVYDLYGRLVCSQRSKPGHPIILSRENFLPGIYLWKSVINGSKPQSGKLIVY